MFSSAYLTFLPQCPHTAHVQRGNRQTKSMKVPSAFPSKMKHWSFSNLTLNLSKWCLRCVHKSAPLCLSICLSICLHSFHFSFLCLGLLVSLLLFFSFRRFLFYCQPRFPSAHLSLTSSRMLLSDVVLVKGRATLRKPWFALQPVTTICFLPHFHSDPCPCDIKRGLNPQPPSRLSLQDDYKS